MKGQKTMARKISITRLERQAAGFDRDEAELRRGNHRADFMEREQDLRDREAEISDRAHERFMRRRQNFVEANPNAVSPFVRRSLLGLQHTKEQGDIPVMDIKERTALRNHELAMLKQKGDNEFRVAEQKRFGMKEQGVDAADIHAKLGLTEAELRFGRFDENGKYIPGSDVHAAQANGLNRAELEQIKGGNRLAVAEANNSAKKAIADGQNVTKRDISQRDNETKRKIAAGMNETKVLTTQIRADASAERARQRDEEAEQHAFDNWTRTALDAVQGVLTPAERAAFQAMTPEDRRQFWIRKTGRKARGTTASRSGNGSDWKSVLGW